MGQDRRRHRSVRGLSVRVGLAVLTGGLVAGAVQLGQGSAQAAGAYGATASAAGLLTSTQDPQHFPVGAVIEGDGPIAQSALSSTGQSTGFASFPYPGAFFLSLQGLAASQGAPETPAYPLYAESNGSLKPKDEVKQPGLTLTAQSSPARRRGRPRARAPSRPMSARRRRRRTSARTRPRGRYSPRPAPTPSC